MKKINGHLLILIITVLAMAESGCDGVSPPRQPPAMDKTPAWSPDGKKIAYYHKSSWSQDTTNPSGLYIYRLDTGNSSLVVEGASLSDPDWSPGGERLIYTDLRSIAKIRPDGSGERILFDKGASYAPSVSHDGERVVFEASYRDTSEARALWLMNPDGSNVKSINSDGAAEGRQADWAPESRRLVYKKQLAERGSGTSEIFIMDTTARNRTQLTDNALDDQSPVWSPDGEWIAWEKDKGNKSEIWLMKPDGSNKRFLTRGAEPTWGPNSERLVFTAANEIGERVLWMTNKEGEALRQVTF